jgi:hypothetical protein
MRWAAVSLAGLCALWAPAALQAQEEAFTATGVRNALSGFAADFYSSSCFNPDRPPLPLRVAVAQMEPSTKFRDDEEQTITERIEGALAADPRWFQVRPRRLRWELEEIRKALGDSKSLAAGDQLDGIIAISPEGGRTVDVVAYAYAGGRECVGATRSIAVGTISKSPDVPDKLFQRAARRLPSDKGIERVIVMPLDMTGFATGIPARVMARQLQGQLVNAINQVFQTRAERNPAGNTARSPAQRYVEGMDASGAWQALLHLSRSQGIDVVIEFRGPGNQPGAEGMSDSGYFALDILPADSDPAVIAEAEAVCSSVRHAVDTEIDPDALQALDQKNQCPRLHDDILQKEAGQRERICNEDREHWSNAANLSLEAMESVARTIRCRQVLDQAQRDIRDRSDREAAIERMKSAAADLGTLTDGRTVTARRAAGGDAVTGVLKFQMIEAGSVQIQVDDPAGNLDVELRNSSWQVIARTREGGPAIKEIETRLTPATYYIEAAPADRNRSETYTLRVAKGFIDTAGDTPATAHDLGTLELGAQIIREHVGGTDKGDVFRFTVRERTLLKLTAGDLASDVRVDLLNQSVEVVRSASYTPNRQQQSIESIVEPGSAYYIAVTPAGEVTPYSLGIVLSRVAPNSRPEIAAPAAIGSTPLTFTLAAADTEYYARFTLRELSPLSIDLTWQGQTAHDLNLFREEGGLRQTPASVTRGAASRSISGDFAAGTYIVKVTRASGPAMPFTLALRGLTLYPSKDKAADLEIGAPPLPGTLPADGNNYWARFRVSQGTRVQIVLNDPQNALRLSLENDRGPLPVWPKERTIDSTLPPGIYWVHVNRTAGTGAVPFHLSLQRVTF